MPSGRGPAAAGAPGAAGGGAGSGGAAVGITCDPPRTARIAAISSGFSFSSLFFPTFPPAFLGSGGQRVRKFALRYGKILLASATPLRSFVLCLHIVPFNKRLRANMFEYLGFLKVS